MIHLAKATKPKLKAKIIANGKLEANRNLVATNEANNNDQDRVKTTIRTPRKAPAMTKTSLLTAIGKDDDAENRIQARKIAEQAHDSAAIMTAYTPSRQTHECSRLFTQVPGN